MIKMKNVFHGLIDRLETAEERIFEFKDDTITSKIENQSKRENKTKQKTEQNRKKYTQTVGQLQKMWECIKKIPGEEREKGIEAVFDCEFPEMSDHRSRRYREHEAR